MATVMENVESRESRVDGSVAERHKSQIEVLAKLTRIEQAIRSLPLDLKVSWMGEFAAVFLDRESFVELFRGFTAKETDGRLTVEWKGVTYCSSAPTPKPTHVQL
jgi:hypothetical protein